MIKNRSYYHNNFDTIGEKCGVAGVWTKKGLAPQIVRRSLAALQHRGQESAGITVLKKDELQTYTGMGLIPHVLTNELIANLGQSNFAIAHNRYSTTGKSSLLNAQPITLMNDKLLPHNYSTPTPVRNNSANIAKRKNKNQPALFTIRSRYSRSKENNHQISVAHNGNIPDLTWLKKNVVNKPTATSDTALLTALFLEQRKNYESWEKLFIDLLPEINGAYSLVILTNEGNIFGIRDIYGIRPFCLGKLEKGWVLASESVSLDVVGASFVREIQRGEIIKISKNGEINSFFFGEPKQKKFCIFEKIYFSRPDSFIDGQRVKKGREECGKKLAERLKHKGIIPDVVVPVFDSGYPAAKGVSQALGIPIVEAITKSHYVGRTFIQPGKKSRIAAVNGKHNYTPDDIIGKKVLFVDDSAVRLTTSPIITKGLRQAGAKEVHGAFASPPVVNQCNMGIDMKTKKELPASAFEHLTLSKIEKNISKLIDANSTTYLPIEETAAAFDGEVEEFYYYPFGGPHPIIGKQCVFPKRKREINEKPKIVVFASGNGTNLQEIIKRVEAKDIEAQISEVIVNNKDVFAIERAKKHNIPYTLISSEGIFKNPLKRNEYNERLINHIEDLKPDLIVLAGWNIVLNDDFLKRMQELEIIVINIHPALLPHTNENEVMTSQGKIPVIRGKDGIHDAFKMKLRVSGVTVHQLLPYLKFDNGPVILKEELKIDKNDTLEEFEKKIHEIEYRVYPTAIKKVLHVMKNGIDASKGDFPWIKKQIFYDKPVSNINITPVYTITEVN